MHNPYQTGVAKIVKITNEAAGIKLFELKPEKSLAHQPGQFIMLSLPGFGEAPFAPCNKIGGNLELCVRAIGRLTNKLHTLEIGDKVGVRGPFGNGWPIAGAQIQNAIRQPADKNQNVQKRNLLIVVGGLGLVPLRTLLFDKEKFLGKDTNIQIFYGAKTPEEFLFKDDFEAWRQQGIDLQLTIDKECEGWESCVGVVTVLFDRRNVVSDARAFLCGPPLMYKFALQKVKEKKFRDEDIYLSFERRMHCGVGVCQHCAIGSHYTCKNGPVFRYSEIKDIPGAT